MSYWWTDQGYQPIKVRIRINHIIMESNFNNLNVINTLLRWRVHLIVILIIALVGSVILSMVITPKFKSWAVVYPANISPYSEESETEQMFQVLQASYVREKVIAKYNLPTHYEIDSSYRYFKTALLNEYRESVKVSKTPGEAIRIEVLDRSPDTAMAMVNTIIEAYNEKVRKLHEVKFGEVVAMWGRSVDRKKQTIDSLERQLNTLAVEDGLLNYESQSTEVIKGLLGTVEGGATHINKKEVAKLRKSIEEKGGMLLLTLDNLQHEGINLREITSEYDKAFSNYDRKYSYTNVIEAPFAADKKSSPVRWLIVALTMFATLFFSLSIIGIVENLRIRKAQK